MLEVDPRIGGPYSEPSLKLYLSEYESTIKEAFFFFFLLFFNIIFSVNYCECTLSGIFPTFFEIRRAILKILEHISHRCGLNFASISSAKLFPSSMT